MARITGVQIDSGKLEAWIPAGLVPQDQWPELLRQRAWFVKEHLPSDCRRLVQFVDEAEQMYQVLGYKNSKDLIRNGLELDPAEIKHALDWLRIAKPDKPVTLKNATILGQHGGARKKGEQVSNRNLKGGVNAAYGLARLDRDSPELAAEVREGKLSVNAAAIKAGFRIKTISIPLEVERAARILRRHFSKEECAALAKQLINES